MPTYEYRCKSCGRQFEVRMTMSRHEHSRRPHCPKCKSGNVQQVPASFQAVTSKKT